MPGAGLPGPAGRRACGAVRRKPGPAPAGPLPLVQGQGGEQVRFSYRKPGLFWISHQDPRKLKRSFVKVFKNEIQWVCSSSNIQLEIC